MEDTFVREALHGYVEENEPPMATTSAGLVASGRRSRRRRAGATVGVAAGTAVVVVATGALLVPGTPRGTPAPPAGPVAGTATGRAIDAAVRRALPHGDRLVLRRVYPSDWNHDGPIGDPAAATDWHGFWTLRTAGGTQTVRVDLMYLPSPDGIGPCGVSYSSADCRVSKGPGGTEVTTYQYQTLDSAGGSVTSATLWARHYRTPTFEVTVGDEVATRSAPLPDSRFAYTRAQLARAATDAALTIPKPVAWPSPSTSASPSTSPSTPGGSTPPQDAARIRQRLGSVVTTGLPGGGAFTVAERLHPQVVDQTRGPVTVPDAQAARATQWYGAWAVPGGTGAPGIGLEVSAPNARPASQADAREMCVSDAHDTPLACDVTQGPNGSWTVTYDSHTTWSGSMFQRMVAVLRADGSIVTLSEWVTAETQATAHLPYSADQLRSVAKDPNLYIPPAKN